ncbi:MAG: sulfatase-like hydrolase/transferase [Thermodesulfobacteriota bacterium]
MGLITRRKFIQAGLGALTAAGLGLGPFPGPASGKKPEGLLGPDGGKPNFIVFLVDMVRPDHLGLYGYPKNTSPHLDRLAEKALVFDQAYAPASWTLPSVVSLLTGLSPSAHGATHLEAMATVTLTENWLPRVFGNMGYRTACFHTHPYLREETSNIHRGFEHYCDPSRSFFLKTPGRRGDFSLYMFMDTLYPALEGWLAENHDEPFFIYLHAIDVHGHYYKFRVLEEDREAFGRGLADGSIKIPLTEYGWPMAHAVPNPHKSYLYDGHIYFVDGYFGRLLSLLEELGLSGRTYVVYTSDHGEGFGEHHDWWSHGRYAYEHQIRVPLVLLPPAGSGLAGGRVPHLVNTTGLLPTLLDLVGLNVDEYVDGKSFLPLLAPAEIANWHYPSFSESGRHDWSRETYDGFLAAGGYKLVTNNKTGDQVLFDLGTDPGELAPLGPREAADRGLEEAMSGLVQARSRYIAALKTQETETRDLDPETLERLKDLGYM